MIVVRKGNNMKKLDKLAMASIVGHSAANVTEVSIGDDIVVHVYDLITPVVIPSIVSSVVEGCFDTDGVYDPSKKEFLKKFSVLVAYTDIEFMDDVFSQYAFVYRSGVYEEIIQHINQYQLEDIFRAIDDLIAYKKRISISVVEADMAKLFGELNAVVEQFRSMYSDVSGEDIKKLVGAINRTKFDEKKLVNAIVESGDKSK